MLLRSASALQDLPETFMLAMCQIHECGFSPGDGWDSGFSPVHWAAQNGRRDLIEYMIKRNGGEEIVNVRDSQGKTPLAYSLPLRRLALFEWLRSEAGATAPPNVPPTAIISRPNMQGLPEAYALLLQEVEKHGWAAMDWTDNFTMLHWAAEEGRLDICKYLLKLDADPNTMDHSRARTPIELAMENNHTEIEAMLADVCHKPRSTLKLSCFEQGPLQERRAVVGTSFTPPLSAVDDDHASSSGISSSSSSRTSGVRRAAVAGLSGHSVLSGSSLAVDLSACQ